MAIGTTVVLNGIGKLTLVACLTTYNEVLILEFETRFVMVKVLQTAYHLE